MRTFSLVTMGNCERKSGLCPRYYETGRLPRRKGQGLEFDMKYHIFHDSGTSTPLKKKFFNHFKDLHKLKFVTNSYVNLMLFLGGTNYVLKV